jgi:hypothetical protein
MLLDNLFPLRMLKTIFWAGTILFTGGCAPSDTAPKQEETLPAVKPADCNRTSGFFYSQLRKDCVQLFKESPKLKPTPENPNPRGSVLFILSEDEARAEIWLPFYNGDNPILQRSRNSGSIPEWRDERFILRKEERWSFYEGDELLYLQPVDSLIIK